ncbi:hypothetical protein EVAR_85_1 [Eumeta japonica]|uniref:Uncharacterized protein n=1 Tax=Eumeta variegata TaxID=151549 RepID=A0A4C1S954_EUMVA|nr:hypothetical protein EVAR_85_1 [Eumeta japonica]
MFENPHWCGRPVVSALSWFKKSNGVDRVYCARIWYTCAFLRCSCDDGSFGKRGVYGRDITEVPLILAWTADCPESTTFGLVTGTPTFSLNLWEGTPDNSKELRNSIGYDVTYSVSITLSTDSSQGDVRGVLGPYADAFPLVLQVPAGVAVQELLQRREVCVVGHARLAARPARAAHHPRSDITTHSLLRAGAATICWNLPFRPSRPAAPRRRSRCAPRMRLVVSRCVGCSLDGNSGPRSCSVLGSDVQQTSLYDERN